MKTITHIRNIIFLWRENKTKEIINRQTTKRLLKRKRYNSI